MTSYTLAPITDATMREVVKHLRDVDVEEIKAMHGQDASVAKHIKATCLVSRDTSFAAFADGTPFCLLGVYVPTLLNGVAVPWLVATEAVSEHTIKFLRVSKRTIQCWADYFGLLRNHVYERNVESIRWLQWLGVDVYSPEPFGVDGLPFCEFELRGQKRV